MSQEAFTSLSKAHTWELYCVFMKKINEKEQFIKNVITNFEKDYLHIQRTAVATSAYIIQKCVLLRNVWTI